MDRDRRLTGVLRGQTDNAIAPPGFEVNQPWRVRASPTIIFLAKSLQFLGRETLLLINKDGGGVKKKKALVSKEEGAHMIDRERPHYHDPLRHHGGVQNVKSVSGAGSCSAPPGACMLGISPGLTCTRSAYTVLEPVVLPLIEHWQF